MSLARSQWVQPEKNQFITCLREQEYDYIMVTEKHKIKVFSASVTLGEKYLISKNSKNVFHIERLCFGAQTKWTVHQEMKGQFR